MKTAYHPRGQVSPLALLLAVALSVAAAAFGCAALKTPLSHGEQQPDLADAVYIGTDACAVCHSDVHARYLKTVHARPPRSGAGRPPGCEQCHGPGSRHAARNGDSTAIYRFDGLAAEFTSGICLSCHELERRADWPASPHLLAGIGCTACHRAHAAAVPRDEQFQGSDICLSCHREKKAAMLLPSRHPVMEGKMSCAACHDSHGAGPGLLKKESVNEQCLECHAEYQGPFAYEHAPVTEDCSICHEPHGTVANSMLRQEEPFLCLRCHRAHRNDPGAGAVPTNGALLTACLQCHGEVHGTDLPERHTNQGHFP